MGNQILVSVFDSERAAFEGLTALKDLHKDGDITLYASTVIAKDASGSVAVRQTADGGPVGTLVGIVTGGLVGLLGGPVGVAMGAYVAGFGGLMYDLFKAGISMDFVDEVSATLTPGKAAVIADIDENLWVTPVDTRLGELGATTFRRAAYDIVDVELVQETESARKELGQLKAELKESTGEAKATLERKIDGQREKLESLVARVDEAIHEEKDDFEARFKTLREQQLHARANQREHIDNRIEELKAAHEVRKAKLQEARRLAKSSVEATREALVP